jgi:thiosulfate reductase cytochrome b subunit
VPTSWSILPGAWRVLLEYLHLHLVVTPGHYNPLEQLAYFSVVRSGSASLYSGTGLAKWIGGRG